MKKSTLLNSVCVISFVISAAFSIIWFTSDTIPWITWAFWLNAGMALVFEGFKIGSGFMAFIETWVPVQFRVICGILSIGLLLYSILGSAGFLTNVSAKNKNKELTSSIQFKDIQSGREKQKQRFDELTKEIEDLKSLKVQQQNEGEKIVNSMPRDYIDRKNQQRVATQRQISDTQKLIDDKSKEQAKITDELKTPINTSNIKIISEKGGTSLYLKMAEALNTEETKDNPFTAEGIEMGFKIFASVIFEIIAWVSGILAKIAKKHENGELSPTPSNPDPEKMRKPRLEYTTQQPNVTQEIQSGRLQGMRFKVKSTNKSLRPTRPTPDLTEDNKPTPAKNNLVHLVKKETTITQGANESDIQKYFNLAKNNLKENGDLPGRKDMSELTGFGTEKCRTIHNILKDRGLIETGNKRTWLVKAVV